MSTLDLHVIVGSIRPGRLGGEVAPWVIERAKAHGAFMVHTDDLAEWDLPMFAEHMGSIGDISNPTYSDERVHQWNATMKEADAVLVITPEYNHSVPGVVKNALDSVFVSWALRNKPLGVVSYSGGQVGGARAIEHLVQIGVEMEMVPLRNNVIVARANGRFGNDGPGEETEKALGILLDDLAWWAGVLHEARVHQLAPAALRG